MSVLIKNVEMPETCASCDWSYYVGNGRSMCKNVSMTEKTDMKDHRQNKKAEERRLVRHPFPPLYDENSKILILGSFPSVKSREMAFFYGHPQNRFWKLLSRLLEAPFPETVPERRAFLLAHGIALWDVIASCEIHGSSDASIRNAVPNDLRKILDHAQIQKPLREAYGDCAKAVVLPSTSPANAAWTMDRLMEAWRVIPEQL